MSRASNRAAFGRLEVRAGRDQAPCVHEVDRHVRPACRVRHGLEPVGLRVVHEPLREQDDRLPPACPLERGERPLQHLHRLAIPADRLAIDPLRATLDVRLDDADVRRGLADLRHVVGAARPGHGLMAGHAIRGVASPTRAATVVSWNTVMRIASKSVMRSAVVSSMYLAVGLIGQREQPRAIVGRPRVEPAASARRDERHGVLIADRLVDELAERLPRRGRLLPRQVHVVEDQDEGAAGNAAGRDRVVRDAALGRRARGDRRRRGGRQLDGLELRDRLRRAVLEDGEVRAREARHRLALLVEHHDVDRHEIDAGFEARGRLLRVAVRAGAEHQPVPRRR